MYSDKILNEQHSAKDESLMIDSHDSVYEKEADDIAMKVIHGDQLMLGGDGISNGQIMGGNNNNGIVSTKRTTGEKNDMVAPGYVQEDIEATKGKGDALPEDAKRIVKGKTSWDLDEVRIHTDSTAAKLSKAVNAKAFTVGKDIYFGQGKFDTYTTDGKELLAHELAHTKQNNGLDSQVLQRKTAVTNWGTFDTTFDGEETYALQTKPYSEDGKTVEQKTFGAGIRIRFIPGDKVNASKIAMLQATKGVINNELDKPKAGEGKSITTTDAIVQPANQSFKFNDTQKVDDSGFHIDQKKNNPLYGGTKLGKDETIKDSKFAKAFGDFGYRYPNGESKEATLGDAPAFFDLWEYDEDKSKIKGPNSGQLFEATALAIEAPKTEITQKDGSKKESSQEGTYYGSVQWGWKNDENGKGTLLDFKVISSGATSSTFMKSAEMWNNAKGLKGEDLGADLPLYDYYYVKSDSELKPDDANKPKQTLKPGARLMATKGTDISSAEIHVTVVDGGEVGTMGMIATTNLQEERDYYKNIK